MYPKVMKYMEWCEHEWDNITTNCIKCGRDSRAPMLHPFDGNDMLFAKDRLVKDGKWSKFYYDTHNLIPEAGRLSHAMFSPWLFQPTNFFRLLEEWLPEVKK